MKHITLFIAILFILSCGSTKKIAKSNSETVTSAQMQKPDQQPQGGAFEPPKEDLSQLEMPKEANETPIINPTAKENPTAELPETNESIVEHGATATIETIAIEAFDHNSFNALLKKHVTQEGNVDYKGFKNDVKSLRNYITLLGQSMPTNDWSKEDKLAYWINAYNAMTIDLIIRNYPVNSIKDIDKPWEQRLWKLDEKWYNLDEIEHQILRKMDEPRIHFGIVCASFSCPKLQNEAFTASNLDAQLADATKEFLADTKRNNISENNLKLSKIFKWFAKDFKQNGSLIDFLNRYTEVTISKNAKKSFKDYNWDLNE